MRLGLDAGVVIQIRKLNICEVFDGLLQLRILPVIENNDAETVLRIIYATCLIVLARIERNALECTNSSGGVQYNVDIFLAAGNENVDLRGKITSNTKLGTFAASSRDYQPGLME